MNKEADDRWENRLQTWALYMATNESGASVKISSAYSLVGRGASAEGDGIPIHVGEALDTHALVLKLPDYLRQAVEVWYCETGTAGEKAAGLSIHRDTLADRVSGAKRRLDDMHRARQFGKSKTLHASPQTL